MCSDTVRDRRQDRHLHQEGKMGPQPWGVCSREQDPERYGQPGSGPNRCTGPQTVPYVPTALLNPGSDLLSPQTHVFPWVSRLSCTAGFTLQGMSGEGVWPCNFTPPCPGTGQGTRPTSPSHPAALAILGHLWHPVKMGQEAI